MKQKWWVISGASINEANVWNNKKTIIDFFLLLNKSNWSMKQKWWVITGASINEANVWNNKKTIIDFFLLLNKSN